MLPLLRGQTDSHRQVVGSALGRWRLAWDGRYELISGFHLQARGGARAAGENPPDIFFDLQEDPVENINIAQKAPEIVQRFRAEL